MNTKILSGLILVILITSAIMFLGCGEKGENVYPIPEPIVVNFGNKFLKLKMSLGVTETFKKDADSTVPKLRHEIISALEQVDTTQEPKEGWQSFVAQKVKDNLKNFGVQKVYITEFVFQ